MNRYRLPQIASAFLLTVFGPANLMPLAADETAAPNLILMMGDDHGWEETGYNGHPYLKTPVLDEMAATGLRMDRFYAAHSSCSPTRGSFVTGRHPNRYGTFAPGWSLRPEETTIADLLAESGYHCGHFGKWHLGPVKKASPTSPGNMGFHDFVSHDNFFELNPSMSRQGGPPEVIEGESSAIVIDETIRFIGEAREQEKPFLAVVWFGSPHEPYQALSEDLALYDNLPEELQDRQVKLTSNETGLQTKRPLREVLRERYAEITAMDRAIGTLRTYLKSEGLRDNTLLFYCGDNGTPRSGVLDEYSPLRGLKGQLYEGGIRVPGLIEWPARISEPRTTSVPAVTSDLLPTACALAGVDLPGRPLDGIGLVDLIDGTMESRPEPIGFWAFANAGRGKKPYIDSELQKGTTPLVKLSGGTPKRNFRNVHHPSIVEDDYEGERALIDEHMKLYISRKGEVALFDLEADSAEIQNLADQKPETVERMQKELRNWQASVLNSLMRKDYVKE